MSKQIGNRKQDLFWVGLDKTKKRCWNWTGKIGSNGYGTLHFNGKKSIASRVAWILSYGKIPKGKYVCHKCDNILCVNPLHLFLGTARDNFHDCIKKGRIKLKGSNNGRSKLTEKQIIEIRNSTLRHKDLIKKYNVCSASISNIKNGKAWKHL